jgi:DNA mismatch repair protein MutL
MGKIIILDENTVNKIAAGEVVERPASVVKELVENSIDAGASVINVEIRNGGISFIRVTDNGCGMSEDDAAMAFESHATSKIRRVDDLSSITSMGFRGEALASIAAVSKVQLLTRTHDSLHGVCVSVTGGSVNEIKPAGCPAGTSITVSELFFNTPARYKFLKKDATEAGYAEDILCRIALAHPEISFTLTNNGRKALYTPGNGDLKSAVFSIYGAETAKHMANVAYEDGGIKIAGFAGLAETARSGRVNQSIYINRRYIRNKTVTSAIDAAYSTFLMRNKYPFIVLNIGIDPSKADVNVHPSKLEVKFSNEQDIFRAVYHAVNNALLSQSSVRTLNGSGKSSGTADKTGYEMSAKQSCTGMQPSVGQYSEKSLHQGNYTQGKASYTASYTQQEFELIKKELDRKYQEAVSGKNLDQAPVKPDLPGNGADAAISSLKPEEFREKDLPDKLIEETPDKQIDDFPERHTDGSTDIQNEKTGRRQPEPYEVSQYDSGYIKDAAGSGSFEKKREEAGGTDAGNEKTRQVFSYTRIVGQLFSTYILLEGTDELYLLDQHAAHERIRYEKLKKAYELNKPLSQMLLQPVHITLTGSECQYAMDEAAFFEKLGFIFDSFGPNSIIIRSAPLFDENTDIKGAFIGILDFVMSEPVADKSLIADEALYRMACRSAIKANDKLDEREIEALLADLSALENPFTCPHGRPAIFKIRRYDLEKLFKRIV